MIKHINYLCLISFYRPHIRLQSGHGILFYGNSIIYFAKIPTRIFPSVGVFQQDFCIILFTLNAVRLDSGPFRLLMDVLSINMLHAEIFQDRSFDSSRIV